MIRCKIMKKTAQDIFQLSIACAVLAGIPGPAMSQSAALSEVVKPGSYQVFVSLGDRDGTPRLALPPAGGDAHHRYYLGTLAVTP
jgi:hypothetical protein